MTDIDWKAAVDWPAEGYIDPHTGEQHDWDEQVPIDPDFEYDDGTPSDYTYRDLVGDQAEAAHMEVDEYLHSMRYDRSGVLDDEDDDPGAVGDYPDPEEQR